MIGEPIIGTYWREQYLEVKRQRDEARAEIEHLKEIMVMATKPEEDWADLRAQTKEQLVREHYEMLEDSRRSTEAMNRAKAKIDELRVENERLRVEQTQYPFNVAVAARSELREVQAENERLRAGLDAAERLIEIVRAREIGTASGVGAAFEAYDTLPREV